LRKVIFGWTRLRDNRLAVDVVDPATLALPLFWFVGARFPEVAIFFEEAFFGAMAAFRAASGAVFSALVAFAFVMAAAGMSLLRPFRRTSISHSGPPEKQAKSEG
jgi:hypothetical protein